MADDTDRDGRTALMMAAAGGHVEEAPVFMQSDATGLGPEGPGLLPVAYGAENIKAAGLAEINVIKANATSIATQTLNRGAG